eukprot:COSAG01_NODE_758_length_13805_cov_23.267912_11_plen_156_part_00
MVEFFLYFRRQGGQGGASPASLSPMLSTCCVRGTRTAPIALPPDAGPCAELSSWSMLYSVPNSTFPCADHKNESTGEQARRRERKGPPCGLYEWGTQDATMMHASYLTASILCQREERLPLTHGRRLVGHDRSERKSASQFDRGVDAVAALPCAR